MAGLEFSNHERVDLVMYNSHGQGCAFHLMASIWRKICSKGMITASRLFSFFHKHINFDGKELVASAYKIAGAPAGLTPRSITLRPLISIQMKGVLFLRQLIN